MAEIYLVPQKNIDCLHLPWISLRIRNSIGVQLIRNIRSRSRPICEISKNTTDHLDFGLWSRNEDNAITFEVLLFSRLKNARG